MNVYLIEGLDRLGKSTLIDGIQQERGFHQVIHYSKPQILKHYEDESVAYMLYPDTEDVKKNSLYKYQRASFETMFGMIRGAWEHWTHLIMDRAHLGEMVYAPLYRDYSGDYVLELERTYGMDRCHHAKLILLTENFGKSEHFADDGQSLGPESAREKEQEMFLRAFDRSIFLHKQIINVTAEDGSFRPKEDILKEALS